MKYVGRSSEHVPYGIATLEGFTTVSPAGRHFPPPSRVPFLLGVPSFVEFDCFYFWARTSAASGSTPEAVYSAFPPLGRYLPPYAGRTIGLQHSPLLLRRLSATTSFRDTFLSARGPRVRLPFRFFFSQRPRSNPLCSLSFNGTTVPKGPLPVRVLASLTRTIPNRFPNVP